MKNNKKTLFGSLPQVWDHLDLILGLGSDLLPVVSNPNAEIAHGSSLKALGKTPSVYNRNGQVVGISDWTSRETTNKDIERWSKQPDYGICLQTRRVRAIDVDIVDSVYSNEVWDEVGRFLGMRLPTRRRPNSGKLLLIVQVEGEFPKRVIHTEHGPIEFLANGQQMVFDGTHDSGVRYEWEGGLPTDIPEIDANTYHALFNHLVATFGDGETSSAEYTARRRGDTIEMADALADWLHARGLVLDTGRNGELHIECPWHAEHSSGEPGDGSTTYFPAGTNGYEQGHFRCLHAHCASRTDGDFIAALGYVADQFDVVVAPPDEPPPLPRFTRDKNGRIEATVPNLILAVRRPDFCGMDIRIDEFRDELVYSTSCDGCNDWRPFGDADYTLLRETLERRGFKPVGREIIRDVVLLIATQNKFDTAQVWLDSLQWDGTPRVDKFLKRYMSANDTPYNTAVSRYLWTAMAGRVLVPGVQADMAVVLIGEQGEGKTTGVRSMVPGDDHFVEVRLDKRDEDTARELRGKLIGEISELRGLMSRESEDIKSWLSRRYEEWVPKYREFATKFPRRLVFVGTTNRDEFLVDDTGNRRWLPVRVGKVNVAGIENDRDQLWAEGAAMFLTHGVMWKDAENYAKEVHEDHMVKDPWTYPVMTWLDERCPIFDDIPRNRDFLRAGDVLKSALNIDAKNVTRKEENRIGNVLRICGFMRVKKRVNGSSSWVWVRNEVGVPSCSLPVPS